MRTFTILTVAAAALALGTPEHGIARAPTAHARAGTTIVVQVRSNRGLAPTHLMGVNHHYNANGYHLWNAATDAPAPGAVSGALRAGLQTMRFPGGTVANTYDWKRAIGPDHLCQVVGPHGGKPAQALTRGLAFGPDEFTGWST